MGAEPAIYRFDRFVLDLRRGALLSEEAERKLRPKSFTLLRHLVENPERLIGRDEIMQAVWPGVFVTEDNIAQCAAEIRRALGEDGRRLLRTVSRRGYLFAAKVLRAAAAAAAAPLAASPPARSAEAPPKPPTGRPLVVVLPFETIGNDPEQVYFANGLTIDLVTDLTRFQNLHVVSPDRGPRQRTLPGAPWANPDLAPRRTYLVSGGIRRADGRIRVSVRLEDGDNGAAIWAERYDRRLDDLFVLQQELAEHLAGHVDSRVERDSIRHARRRPPASFDAYDLYVRGRELIAHATEADTLAARGLSRRPIEIDPDFAEAYVQQSLAVQRGLTCRWGEPRGRAAATLAL